MEHSLLFMKLNDTSKREYNTWSTWGLIPASRPTLAQPQPVYKYVDIPGRDGPLDTTDYLIGRPTYTDRKGTFEFYVDNTSENWMARRANLAQFFDGTKMRLRFEDEQDGYCYFGRFFFREWRPGPSYSSVVIEYEVQPYRYRMSDNTEAGL